MCICTYTNIYIYAYIHTYIKNSFNHPCQKSMPVLCGQEQADELLSARRADRFAEQRIQEAAAVCFKGGPKRKAATKAKPEMIHEMLVECNLM